MDRVTDWAYSLHLGTRILVVFMVVVYVIQFLFVDPRWLSSIYLIPAAVFRGELWRLVTAVFVHGGLLHLVFNMLSFTQLGATLETRIGTVSFLYHILLFAVLTSVLHSGIALFMHVGGNSSQFYSASVGFSGVLFALMVIDAHVNEPGPRAVLGLFTVQSRMYPWVMLFVLQLLLRNVSFLGHISGIFVGYLYNTGLLRWAVPSTAVVQSVERRCCPTPRVGFVPAEGINNRAWRPFTVFSPRWADDDDDSVVEQAQDDAFRGTGRTIGDVPQETWNEAQP